MGVSGADKLILLVQTNQVLYDKSAAGYKSKTPLKRVIFVRLVLRLVVEIGERTIDLVCRFSFLGGSVTVPSDF